MSFGLADAVLPVPDRVRQELRREWRRLAGAGTWLTGPQRVAVACEARAARTFADAHSGLPEPLIEAAQSVSAAAHLVTGEWVADLTARGVTIEQYVEIVGVVSRLTAVDSYLRGIGAEEEPLPEPTPGRPTGERDDRVQWRRAFVPTAPEDGARFALSAVPAEEHARDQLHAVLYLSTPQMADFAYQGALSRAQMELLAARVSLLNDCFYQLLAHANMLRVSVQKTIGTTVDLRAVVEDRIDPGLPWGGDLRNLATAMITGQRLEASRTALSHAMSPEAAAAAVGVCANFEMMNRILDATGCPVPEQLHFVSDLLGVTHDQ